MYHRHSRRSSSISVSSSRSSSSSSSFSAAAGFFSSSLHGGSIVVAPLNVNDDCRVCVYPSGCVWAALVGAKILTFSFVEVSPHVRSHGPSRNSDRWFIMGRVRARAVREVSRMREYVNVSRNAWLITRAITRDARCDLIFLVTGFLSARPGKICERFATRFSIKTTPRRRGRQTVCRLWVILISEGDVCLAYFGKFALARLTALAAYNRQV